MAKEDDFESLQKFLVCKGPKRCGILFLAIGMVDLMTLAAHLQRDSVAQAGTRELDQMIHPPIFNDPPEGSIFPLPGVRQVSMGKK